MTEHQFGLFLLTLSLLFAISYLLGVVLERMKIPAILAPLLVAMLLPQNSYLSLLTSGLGADIFKSLADLGVLFLLLFIGMQIDLKEMKNQSKDIILATVLNTSIPFVLGFLAMLYMGYGWIVSFVVGVTRMPTAEAVVIPILDEYNLIKSRVGSYIVGAGVLDDVIEVFLVAFVSIWIEDKSGIITNNSKEIGILFANISLFILGAYLGGRFILRPLLALSKPKNSNLIFFTIMVLFLFGGFAEFSDLGLVVGAIVAGILMSDLLDGLKDRAKESKKAIRAFAYGFFGVIFFLWIGMSVDLKGLIDAPELAILLFLAAFVGKIAGIFLMVPMKKLTIKEAWSIGIGLNARLTTEIIVAKLLYDAKLIDDKLFSAIIAASSLSTLIVPILFTLLLRKWGRSFINDDGAHYGS